MIFIDPDGMWGDYYGTNGEHMGSDGKDDNKAYVADNVTKDKKGLVTAAENLQELAVSNSDLIKLGAVVNGEAGDGNNKEEKFGIASASMNNFKARNGKLSLNKTLSKISNATFDGNEKYGDFMDASYDERNNNAGMKTSMAAAINAVTGGVDFSNGATDWDGTDLKTNSHRIGLHIADPAHDIFKVGDRPFKPKRMNSSYARETTGAAGHTVFMKISPEWIKNGGGKL